MTEKCISLKQHLEQLVKEGHLRRFLSDGQKQHLTGEPMVSHNSRTPAKVIKMIHASHLNDQSHDWMRSGKHNI